MTKKEKINAKVLYSAILALENEAECAAFFDDICTCQELESLVQRLDVAILLNRGNSYINVNKLTGASTATIGRVSKALNYGNGGYSTVIERLENNDN